MDGEFPFGEYPPLPPDLVVELRRAALMGYYLAQSGWQVARLFPAEGL